MLGLFEEMFGKAFWEHAIVEITFYAHLEKNLTINDKEEKKIEGVVNSMLKRELDLKSDLKSTFIDSHYHDKYPEEAVAFAKNAKKLFEFANCGITEKQFYVKTSILVSKTTTLMFLALDKGLLPPPTSE